MEQLQARCWALVIYSVCKVLGIGAFGMLEIKDVFLRNHWHYYSRDIVCVWDCLGFVLDQWLRSSN